MTVKELMAILSKLDGDEVLTMWGGECMDGDVATITVNDCQENEEIIWQTLDGKTV